MKLTYPILLASIAFSCGKGSSGGSNDDNTPPAVEQNLSVQDGYCTHLFLNDYNNVVRETNMFFNYGDRLDLADTDEEFLETFEKICKSSDSVKKSAKLVLENHKNVSCKAEVDYEEATLNSSDVQRNIDMVTEFTNNMRAELPDYCPEF